MLNRSRRWRWLGLGVALLGCAGSAWLVMTVLADPARATTPGRGGESASSAAVDGDGYGVHSDGARRNATGAANDTTDTTDPADPGSNPDGPNSDPGGPGNIVPGGINPPAFPTPTPTPEPGADTPPDPADSPTPDTPPAVAPPPADPPGMPRSARDPTLRERAERRRYRNGRRLPHRDDLPEQAEQVEPIDIDMSRIAEPEVWAAYWEALGIPAPEMVATPVVGKVIDQLSHKGLAAGTVYLYTFFAASSRLDGPLLPLAVWTHTDDNGFFAFNLPVPPASAVPADYPRLALGVASGGRRLIDAITLDVLRPGEPNELGVFWAPHEPFEVQADVARLDEGLRLASTGPLDPLRWDARMAGDAFATFPSSAVTAATVEVRGSWDPIADPPFVTLTRNGAPQITRRCVLRPVDDEPIEDDPEPEPAIGQPFVPLLFPNDGALALAGTIADASGTTMIEGAVITLTVGGEERVTFSDAWGWFRFLDLPDRKVSLRVAHERYVDETRDNLLPGAPDLFVQMRYLRPRLPFRFRRTDTGEPVNEVWFRWVAITNPGSTPEQLAPETAVVKTSTDGTYLFEHPLPLKWLRVEASGLKPQLLPVLPAAGGATQDVWLQAGRLLERMPRNYDAAQNAGMWHAAEKPEDGYIWSLDDDHWLDYTFDLGEEATFALVLGVKNHAWNTLPLDNEYTFEVDILLDGQPAGRLSIPSDAQVTRLGRLTLGKLSGPHTIRLLWTNDRYIPGQLDANISYERLQLVETGVDGE
ncbi:MAG: carboxypeptidase-like regulatory domain-containing protein [Planctomycetota bacterium]